MSLPPAGWLLGCLLPAACAPGPQSTAYRHAMAAGLRAESAGRLAEAERAYEGAQRLAQRPRDRDQAAWDAADVLVHDGRIADALARLDAMAHDATSEHQAAAAYRAGSLRVEHGDPARGWREIEAVPRRFPAHGIARVAVRKLVAHAQEASAESALSELRALDHAVGATELAPLLAFLTAEQFESMGDDRAALDAYLRIADRWPYPHGGFFDDALWRASLLDDKLGRPRSAVHDLERLLAARETTTLMGSYERPRYVPAMLRMAELYEHQLSDPARARDIYHRLYTDFSHSTKRAEALFLEASLWKEQGDEKTACDRLGTLVHDFPGSRYVPCALAECPGLARHHAQGAPRSADQEPPKRCHPYLLREEKSATDYSSSSSSSSSPSSSSSSSRSSSS